MAVEFRRLPNDGFFFLRLGRESGWTLDIVALSPREKPLDRQRLSSNMKFCKVGDKLNCIPVAASS